VVLFGRRIFWATALWVSLSLVFFIPRALAQTGGPPLWQRCPTTSAAEAREQCEGEGRLTGRALSDGYILIGISGILPVEAELNNPDPQNHQRVRNLLLSAADFQAAIEADRTNQRALVCRGIMFLALLSADLAIADFSDALRIEPKDYEVLIARARAYAGKHYFRRSLDDLNRAIEIDPMNASAFGFRGDVFRFLGWPGRAYADYNNAAKREPDVKQWVERRDAPAKLLGRRGKARREASATNLFPTTVTVNFAHGQTETEVRDALKRWEDGEVGLQEARQLFEGAMPRCAFHYL
jgi:tetratricopeptide (TPR) repeat protein